MTPAQREFHRLILRAFAVTGRPPGPAELESAAERAGADARDLLAQLADADLIGLDPSDRIRVAYPFSAEPTPHRVRIANGPQVYAMCAIDALGIAPMLGADIDIDSADPHSGDPVRVSFRDGTATWSPESALVLSGSIGRGTTSEEICCGYMNFFASPASAGEWAAAHPEVTVTFLDRLAAEALGSQIFGQALTHS